MNIRLIVVLFALLLLGKLLDNEAERVIDQLYPRDQNGIIYGAHPIQPPHPKHHQALVFIHGFADTPQVFHTIIKDLQKKLDVDIYAPLLPYHGRSLRHLKTLNNTEVATFIEQELNQLAQHYQSVYVVAHSYAGTVLSQLMVNHRIPSNITPIFYAPAIFIQLNTPMNGIKNHLYTLWRSYCNYPILGCSRTFPASEDGNAQMQEINLQYKAVPAVHKLFELDLKSRENLIHIKRPFYLIK